MVAFIDWVDNAIHTLGYMLGMVFLAGEFLLGLAVLCMFALAVGNVLRLIVLALMGYAHDRVWTYSSGAKQSSRKS